MERAHFGIHYQDSGSDTRFSEFRAFVCHRHGKIVYAKVLQRSSHLHATTTVSSGFNHTSEFHAGTKVRAVEAHIVGKCGEIDFQSRFVHLELEFVGNAFKSKFACTFEEHHGIRKRSKARTCEKIIGMVEALHLTIQQGL